MTEQAQDLKDGQTLVSAVAAGDAALMRACLAAGADVRHADDLPLRCAVYTGRLDLLKELVARGADPRALHGEPLLIAAKKGDVEMTGWLLDRGADLRDLLKHHAGEADAHFRQTIDAARPRAVLPKAPPLRASFPKP